MPKTRKYRVERLTLDQIFMYGGFMTGVPLASLERKRHMRRWPCAIRHCNRLVEFVCHISFKTRRGTIKEAKRRCCFHHTLKFAKKYNLPIPRSSTPEHEVWRQYEERKKLDDAVSRTIAPPMAGDPTLPVESAPQFSVLDVGQSQILLDELKALGIDIDLKEAKALISKLHLRRDKPTT